MRLAKIFKLLQLLQQNNLQDLLGESHKKLNVIVATVLLLKKKIKAIFLSQWVCIFISTYEEFAYYKTCNESGFGWLIRQMLINQKSGRPTFRRFVSGSLFVSPCPPECYLKCWTIIEPDLRLHMWRFVWISVTEMPHALISVEVAS